MSKTSSRMSRSMLLDIYGRWWEIKDISRLIEIRDDINKLPAITAVEKHIKKGMFFRVFAKIGKLSVKLSKNEQN